MALSFNTIVSGIIIVIFIYYILRGYHKGFLCRAAFIVNTLLALILAPAAMPIWWTIFDELQVTDTITNVIQSYLSAYHYSHTVSGVLLDPEMTDQTLVAVDAIGRKILSQNAALIAANITRTLTYALGFLSVRIVLHFVYQVSRFIAHLPLIRQFDKAFGAAAAGVMVLFSIWVIVALMSLLTFIPGIGAIFQALLDVPVLHAFLTLNPYRLLVQAIDAF